MARDKVEVVLRCKVDLPKWFDAYRSLLIKLREVGVPVDETEESEFVLRHTRITIADETKYGSELST